MTTALMAAASVFPQLDRIEWELDKLTNDIEREIRGWCLNVSK